MRRSIFNKHWLLALILFCGSTFSSHSQNIEAFIQKVQAYQTSVKLIMRGDSTSIDANTFDLKTYMQMFDKLKLEKGFVYDYFFYDGTTDGKPYLFVRKPSFNIDDSIAKLAERYPYKYMYKKTSLLQRTKGALIRQPEYLVYNHVIPEDSKEGYVQYLFLHEFGEQFALFWHMKYAEKRIITTADDLAKVIQEYTNNSSFNCNTEELNKLNGIISKPEVDINKDICKVTWYEIATHQGIFLVSYTIGRTTPYPVKVINRQKLVTITPNFFY